MQGRLRSIQLFRIIFVFFGWCIFLLPIHLIIAFGGKHSDQLITRQLASHTRPAAIVLYKSLKGESDSIIYTIEYARNFHRHVVRHRSSNEVVEVFQWLDDALAKYPNSQPIPLYISEPQSYDTYTSSSCVEGACVAGQGPSSNTFYSLASSDTDINSYYYHHNSIKSQLYTLFQHRLQWYPSQVDKLIEAVPTILHWPVQLIEERLDFLMAPLPNNVTSKTTTTVAAVSSIDWCWQYYKHGRGASMSLAQVYHALCTVPALFLRMDVCEFNISAIKQSSYLSQIYTETPAVVLAMASQQLDGYLSGACKSELVAFAYLHWKGWEWLQCRIVLAALPSVVSVSADPSWEIYERGKMARSKIRVESMTYLRLRLQIRPWHILAMLKTHSRLSLYSTAQLQRNCDYIQQGIGCTSAELRRLLLRMPSMLGMSTDGIQKRVKFWTSIVGLSVDEFRQIVLQIPALLQYSIEDNLFPKATFFIDTLQLSLSDLREITLRRPQLWSRSLEKKLKLLADSFVMFCEGMTYAEFGSILCKSPDIGMCNWNGNLHNKLDFIAKSFYFLPGDLKQLVLSTPRVLMHSLPSLQKKVALIKKLTLDKIARETVLNNPSLLLLSYPTLQTRLLRIREYQALVHSESVSTIPGKFHHPRKKVVLLSNIDDSVELEFADVQAAASYAQVSKSHMYKIVQKQKELKGRRYVFALSEQKQQMIDVDETLLPDQIVENISDTAIFHEEASLPKEDVVYRFDQDLEKYCVNLTIQVAGRAFPSEAEVRGQRRTGGMAFRISRWSHKDWHPIVSSLWKGRKMRLLSDGETLLMGYSYTRPSRPRCSLYACREALRILKMWLELRPYLTKVNVAIHLDSSVIDLVSDGQKLLTWGKIPTRKQFCYTGPGPAYKANPDILYPLARSYYHLVSAYKTRNETMNDLNGFIVKPSNNNIVVNVTFHSFQLNDLTKRLNDGALLAAQLMYESV